jgi:hypothetical protein
MNLLHQVRISYRLFRRKVHVRLVRSMQAKPYRPRIYIDKAPRFDDRATIDRFRRESGQR